MTESTEQTEHTGGSGFTLTWQEVSHSHGGEVTFPDWLLVTALAEDRKELMERVSEASEHFTEVTFEILINGYRVDAGRVLTRLEEAFDSAVDRAAREKVEAFVKPPALDRLQDDVAEFASAFRERASTILRMAETPEWMFPDGWDSER